MPFAAEKRTYDETRKRSSKEYVKFSTEWRTVLRILDDHAELTWKHWIQEANAGKGLGAVCPNINAQTKVCPIDLALEGLDRQDSKVIERRARKRYMVNVLDRTPHTTCDACNSLTPGKKCVNCGNDLKKLTFAPLNRIKILEQGPQLFLQQLNPIEQMGMDDWGIDITGYDIVFQAQGVGRDRKIATVPQQPVPLTDADFLDPETGEPQKKFDLSLLAEPNTVEEIELMLKGATMADLNELRGVAV